jgi:signal peptidase I
MSSRKPWKRRLQQALPGRDPQDDPQDAEAQQADDGSPPRKGEKRAPATRAERWKANAKTIIGAGLLAIFIRIVLFEAFEIEGPSMEPTLLSGDRVVVAKFLYGLFLPYTSHAAVTWGRPEPGDVVIVKSPQDEIDIVKRVIGVGGDTVAIRNNRVWRNGEPIPSKELGQCDPQAHGQDWIRGGWAGTECTWVREKLDGEWYRISYSGDIADQPPTQVPEGHIYVLGDHRDRSNDSRRLDSIAVSRVKGKALVIYWSSYEQRGSYLPAVRWGRIGDTVQ